GEVFAGPIATKPSEVVQVLINKEMKPEQSEVYRRFKQVMDWAEKYRKLKVRTNADSPEQAAEAIAFGAEGIGLCRTEHMFFEDQPGDQGEGRPVDPESKFRITAMREMIRAESLQERQAAL